ncbi:MAG: hypothetical protein ACRDHN_09720 [Thermomicrobiales bacterium]
MIKARGLAILITLSLLFIPATCANAAGPHSIFVDPMASHMHHSASDDSDHNNHVVMTQEELELHVLLGHMTADQADAMEATEEASEPVPVVKVVEKNPCQGGPRVKDLPSTMAMAALMNPVTLTELALIEFPCAEVPVDSIAVTPALMVHSPESPPPQV